MKGGGDKEGWRERWEGVESGGEGWRGEGGSSIPKNHYNVWRTNSPAQRVEETSVSEWNSRRFYNIGLLAGQEVLNTKMAKNHSVLKLGTWYFESWFFYSCW